MPSTKQLNSCGLLPFCLVAERCLTQLQMKLAVFKREKYVKFLALH